MAKTAEISIGTSGWQYKDWNGRFYPAEVKGKDQLKYFAEHFKSVEINSTFYHVPRPATLENWAGSVPADFRFVIKLNRYLTHTKRLVPDEQFSERLQEFLELLNPLGDKLAAILVQLPPSMKADNSRLSYLAEQVAKAEKRLGLSLPLALECRHASWFNDDTFAIMREYNIANVINDSPNRWPASKAITADFAYIRFHGHTQLYRSSYSDRELKQWTGFIRKECAGCQKVFCYFNNDYNAVAVRNAQSLQKIITAKV